MNPEQVSQLRITELNPVRWIVVGQLLDAKNKRVLKNAHLVYGKTCILYAGVDAPTNDCLNGKIAPDLSLPDFTALPGLIEGHSHTFLEGAELDVAKRASYQKGDAETLYQSAEKRVHTLARLGVIAMRDGGDKDQVGLRLSKLTANGSCPSLHGPSVQSRRRHPPTGALRRLFRETSRKLRRVLKAA